MLQSAELVSCVLAALVVRIPRMESYLAKGVDPWAREPMDVASPLVVADETVVSNHSMDAAEKDLE